MNDPIIENKHYFDIIDNEIKHSVVSNSNPKEIIELIESKVENILNNHDIESVIKNSRDWFERNTLPENQLKTFIGFMENFKIFE